MGFGKCLQIILLSETEIQKKARKSAFSRIGYMHTFPGSAGQPSPTRPGIFSIAQLGGFFEMQCFLHRERAGALLEGNHIAAARAPPINQFFDMKLSIGDKLPIRSAKYSRF